MHCQHVAEVAEAVGRLGRKGLGVQGGRVERAIVQRQADELVDAETVVDGDALVNRSDERVHGQRVHLGLGRGDQGPDEHVLALDPAEVARPVDCQ